jgi:peptide/nickel transport system substrate-binding protein
MKQIRLWLTLLTLAALVSVPVALTQGATATFTVIRATPWNTRNFNPLVAPSQSRAAARTAIFESLFIISVLDNKTTNVLGTRYAWSNNNRTLTVTTRVGVKWTDGQAFDATDVAFTFNYLKQHPATDTNALWQNGLASVTARGSSTVVFTFSEPNVPMFAYIATQLIVPEHLWKDVKDPATYLNENPVGTGPFTLESYANEAIRLVRNPNYWIAGKPAYNAVVWRFAASNDAALLMMLRNEADFFFGGITDPKGSYADKGPNFRFWWPVTGFNLLYFNTAKAPFNDVSFRRAVASAIDTKDAALKAYSGAIGAADPSAVVPSQRKEWLPGGSASGVKFDPKAADAALTAAGYRKNASGQRLGKDGQPLANVRILVGTGWGDYIAMAQVIAENLKDVGIPASIEQQPYSTYTSSLQTGTFDTAISWNWGLGSTPYYLFYRAFAPELSAPLGQPAASNFTRYVNADVSKALDTYRTSSNAAQQRSAMQTIATTLMRDVPWFPITNRAQFVQYNTSKFTGFPSDEDPYYDGSSDEGSGFRMVLLNVRPK